MSRYDMLDALSYNKRTIRTTIDDMLECGIIELDRVEKKKKYYRLDMNFIHKIHEQLSMFIEDTERNKAI